MAHGEGSVSYDHRGSECKDTRKGAKRHDACTGRWYGILYFEGKRYRVLGKTKGEVQDKLRDKRVELENGIVPDDQYTVANAVQDFLAHGMPGRSKATVDNARHVLVELLPMIGDIKLKKLGGRDVRSALGAYAETRSQSTVIRAHNVLTRAIRFAESNDKVTRNVARTVETPSADGEGRESKSFTLDQMLAILHRSAGLYPMYAYTHLSFLTGIRTEEARALRWSDIDLDSEAPGIDVVRSVRKKGETKTRTSRRGLALPAAAVEALRWHRQGQERARGIAGGLWKDNDLVFTDQLGQPLRADRVCDLFREVLEGVPGIEATAWTPREMRHTFTSILDLHDVPTAEISRLLGHSKVSTTETVYRHELKVRRQAGATAMDNIVPLRQRAG